MDTRDLYKLVRNLSEDTFNTVNLYDRVDIELTGDFLIETGVVGFTEDGIILHLDEDATDMLELRGLLEEVEVMSENPALMALGSAVAMGAGKELASRVADKIDLEEEDDDELAEIRRLAHGEEVDEGIGKALLGGAALIAAITGINKMEADHLMKTEPQLVKLAQMRQAAEQQGDEYKIQELDDRIEQTLDHIRVTGRPVMGSDGNPVVPGEPLGEANVYVKKFDGSIAHVKFENTNPIVKRMTATLKESRQAKHVCSAPGFKWKSSRWSCRLW